MCFWRWCEKLLQIVRLCGYASMCANANGINTIEVSYILYADVFTHQHSLHRDNSMLPFSKSTHYINIHLIPSYISMCNITKWSACCDVRYIICIYVWYFVFFPINDYFDITYTMICYLIQTYLCYLNFRICSSNINMHHTIWWILFWRGSIVSIAYLIRSNITDHKHTVACSIAIIIESA